ncbi:MAG: hypothetical protein IT462_13750 [Planctomycetes bacterium]|nr:hypothetical protein [Planctomycetota bacterium]
MTEPLTPQEPSPTAPPAALPPAQQASVTARPPMRLGIQLLLIFLVAVATSAFVQLAPGMLEDEHGSEFLLRRNYGLLAGDGYYHVRMACLYRSGEMFAAGKDYHWTRGSIWEHHFSDKDFLYHIYLVPFTFLAAGPEDFDGLITAGQVSISVLYGLTAVTIALALYLLGARRIWFFVLLTALCGGVPFLIRLNEARSWIFSLNFSLLGWAFMSRRKHLWLFLLAVVYTLAYTASHLLLALCVFRTLGQLVLGPGRDGMASRKAELFANLKMMGIIAAGLIVGMLLHPQPFELMRMWWIQNAMVLQSSTAGTHEGIVGSITRIVLGYGAENHAITVPQTLMGAELKPPPNARELLSSFPMLFAAPVVLPLAAAWFRWRPSREAVLILAATCVFIAAMLRSIRFVEYAGPWAAVTWGVWVTGLLASRKVLRWREARAMACKIGAAALAAIVVVFFALGLKDTAQLFVPNLPWLEDVGNELRANDDKYRGKVIFNHAWDHFSNLMFWYPHADYVVGLDPVFAAARGDHRGQFYIHLLAGEVEKAVDGKDEKEMWRILRKEFGAEYMLVSPGPYLGAIVYFRGLADDGKIKPIIDARGQGQAGHLFFKIPDVE